MTMFSKLSLLLLLPSIFPTSGFTTYPHNHDSVSTTTKLQILNSTPSPQDNTPDTNTIVQQYNRRSILTQLTTTTTTMLLLPTISNADQDDKTRGGVKLTPFNGLTFNYRGNDFGGLDGSTLEEPSVPYSEFLERLDKDQVAFVEFMAPDGDAAYVTFKDAKEGEKPIRIGDGYPVEDHTGWSSPAFVVKSVKKKGVPYKFTVPALAAYK